MLNVLYICPQSRGKCHRTCKKHFILVGLQVRIKIKIDALKKKKCPQTFKSGVKNNQREKNLFRPLLHWLCVAKLRISNSRFSSLLGKTFVFTNYSISFTQDVSIYIWMASRPTSIHTQCVYHWATTASTEEEFIDQQVKSCTLDQHVQNNFLTQMVGNP